MATEDTNIEEFDSVEAAFEAALADVEGGEASDDSAATPPVEQGEADGAEGAEDAVEQSEDESVEEAEAPSKLADVLLEEQPESDRVEAPSLDSDATVEVPGVGEVTLRELRDGYLRQSDYTQKTQSLAEQRRALEKAEQLWNLLNENPVGTIAEMAVRAGILQPDDVRDLPAQTPNLGKVLDAPAEQPDIEKLVAEKVQETLQKIPELETVRKEASLRKVEGELDRIEKAYGTEFDLDDRVALVKRALESGESLELTYLKAQRQLDRMMRERDRVERSVSKQKGVRQPDADVTDEPPKTVEEAWERAVAELS